MVGLFSGLQKAAENKNPAVPTKPFLALSRPFAEQFPIATAYRTDLTTRPVELLGLQS
jgi:hypothetical protein